MNKQIQKTSLFTVLGGAISLLALASPAQNLLSNGNFENEPNWGGGVSYDGSETALIGSELPGWTIEPNHAVTIHSQGPPHNYLTISGTYSLNTDGEGYNGHNANFYQDFATQTGTNYVLAFHWQSWGLANPPATNSQLEVSLEDAVTSAVLFDGLYSYDGDGQPHPVHNVVTNFVGTGNSVRLRIQEIPESGYNDNTWVVDDFSVISSGNLQVTLFPTCAVMNGAQWQVDGGAFQASGAVVTNLAVGAHTVAFNSVPGWATPSNQTVVISTPTNLLMVAYTVPGTITWINLSGVNSNWSTPANWDRNRAPTNDDVVVIPNTGGNTCTLDVNATVAGLTIGGCNGSSDGLDLNAHTLVVNGPITVSNNAAFTITSGTLVGGANTIIYGSVGWTNGALQGIITLDTSSTLTLVGNTRNLYLTNCTFTNYGTVLWTNGYPDGGGGTPGTVIYNYGLWNCQSDYQFKHDVGGSNVVFNNYGTFRKSAGTNTSSTTFPSAVVLNQLAGQLDLQQGNLLLQGGGLFTGGTATNNNGVLTFNSGNFTLNGTVTGNNVYETGGNLVDNTVINGGLVWQGGGNWNNTTSVVVSAGSTLTLAGNGNNLNFNNCILTNYGTVLWTNGYPDGGGSAPGTIINNYGLWNCQSDWNFKDDGGGSNVVFNNYGTFRKSAGTNTSQTTFPNGVMFNQLAGALDLPHGNLVLQGGGAFTGGTATNNNGVLTFNSGNFTLNGTATGNNVYETGGNMVSNTVINGGLVWQGGGNWNNTTSVVVSVGSTLTLSGGGNNLSFNNCILTNYGTVLWTNGYPDGGGSALGTIIDNFGLWNCQSDYQFKDDGGGKNVVFNNYSFFRKSGGTNTSQTTFPNGVTFNQFAGQVDLQQGNLLLQGGGVFTGGTATNNNGILTFGSGNFTLNGTATGNNVFETGGSLVGNTAINGGLIWQGGGNWNNTTSVVVSASSTVTLAGGSGNLSFNNCILTNYGTVLWTNGNPDGGGSTLGTIVDNYGLWNCQGDYQFKDDGGGSNVVFNNYGTFRKSGGTNTSQTTFGGGVAFNQLAGAVDLQQGNLLLQGGGLFTGGTATNNHGVLTFNNGNFTLNGMATGNNVYETGGNLVGNTAIYGGLIWQGGGNWNNTTSVVVSASSTLTLAGGSGNLNFNNCILTNYGTVLWINGYPDGGGSTIGTIIDNYGLWLCQSNYNIRNDGGGKNTLFNNYGTVRKTGTSGGSSVVQSGVTFTNLGKLDVQLGNINLQGAYNLAGGTLNFGLNSLASYGTISLAGAAALTGTVSANLNNGFIPAAGDSFPVLGYGSKSGSFTSTVLPPGFLWTTNYGSTTYTISVGSVLPSGSVTNLVAQWQPGQAALQFNGSANASYTVLATTNLTVPRTNWIPLGQASLQNGSSFQYLDSQSPAYPQRFYQIRSP